MRNILSIPIPIIYFLILVLFFPSNFVLGKEINPGDVIINEVMWAGSDEWIELYNITDKDINLKNWKVQKGDKQIFSFSHDQIIRKDGKERFFIIELYQKLTDNNYQNLTLINNKNSIIDQISQGSEWIAGKKETKKKKYYSMERVNPKVPGGENCNWKTVKDENKYIYLSQEKKFYGTPGSQNSQYSDIDCRILVADAGDNIISLVDKEIIFDASDSKGLIEEYIWNFGDGKTAKGKIVNHKYKVSGKYIVSLSVVSKGKQERDTIEVMIFPSLFSISEFSPKGKWVEVSNESNFIEDISGFEISNENEKGSGFIFPDNSFIDKQEFLFLPSDLLYKLSFKETGSLFLLYPSGDICQEIRYEKTNEDWVIARKGESYFYTKTQTPGIANIISGEAGNVSSATPLGASLREETLKEISSEIKEVKRPAPPRRFLTKNLLAEVGKNKKILALSGLGMSIFSGFFGFGLIRLRRRLKRKKKRHFPSGEEKETIEVEIE